MSRTIRKTVKRSKQEEIKPKNKYGRKQKQKPDLTKISLQSEEHEDEKIWNRYL